jgi:hypothetical protein
VCLQPSPSTCSGEGTLSSGESQKEDYFVEEVDKSNSKKEDKDTAKTIFTKLKNFFMG